ncbi:hypothetical protein DPMN_088076 [Dreissena polymorpha]|uniref:Uncharacterized protein n=1 Tax=Dreissena polymorpha TaxID=45954 RepID=A0A9D4KV83_DREPO|nr:hypothetical protein DPMN_088076 [Dreissena polymorpha]
MFPEWFQVLGHDRLVVGNTDTNENKIPQNTGKEEKVYSADTVIDDEISAAISESESESEIFENSNCPGKTSELQYTENVNRTITHDIEQTELKKRENIPRLYTERKLQQDQSYAEAVTTNYIDKNTKQHMISNSRNVNTTSDVNPPIKSSVAANPKNRSTEKPSVGSHKIDSSKATRQNTARK